MKNAGKACNNRLYRHIRTFEKIVKNYFVISINNSGFSREMSRSAAEYLKAFEKGKDDWNGA